MGGLKAELSMFLCKPTEAFFGLGFEALAQEPRKIYHLCKTKFWKSEENILLYSLNVQFVQMFCYAVPQNLLKYLVLVFFLSLDIEI